MSATTNTTLSSGRSNDDDQLVAAGVPESSDFRDFCFVEPSFPSAVSLTGGDQPLCRGATSRLGDAQRPELVAFPPLRSSTTPRPVAEAFPEDLGIVGRDPRVRPYVLAYAEEVLSVLKVQDRDVEFLRQREDLNRGVLHSGVEVTARVALSLPAIEDQKRAPTVPNQTG